MALGTSLGNAQAAVFKDAQLESLHEAGKFAELEQQAQARLKANPADAEASAALVLGLSLADPADAKRLEAGAQQAKLCTDRHPAWRSATWRRRRTSACRCSTWAWPRPCAAWAA